MSTDPIRFFDGHNDTLLKLDMSGQANSERLFLEGMPQAHIDLPRAKAGGFAGGFFAIFPPPREQTDMTAGMSAARYDMPLPHMLPLELAQESTTSMVSILNRIERASEGGVTVCRSSAAVREAVGKGSLAAILHIEGAEAIDPDFKMLDLLYAAGLRSLGLVWSRPNLFGHGVPFRFPGDPDTGPGLTDAGKALVKACNQLGIMVDLSHLNANGFRDVEAITHKPLVATHSNVHAICPHTRNLTDWQLAAIRATGGMVGLNFATGFLRPDGRMNSNTELDVMIRHLDAMLKALGEDGVGLGSDFDGALIPAAIGDITGVQHLLNALIDKGYGRELVEKIALGNWLSVIERTIA
ncbi:dipeptidase [Pararhizobium sp.]|uniref:dipeptidase n=1 Tax=Pararhizobium sp. TaxID=1977563 RepID=UPI00272518D7|nr:dipeptidase [Pararhizobium sp.]MDO9416099.1 dipeptidase [Pararhizobium sp.]